MVKYKDGEIADMFPANFKYDVDFASISYAFRMGALKLAEYGEKARMLADIDSQPDEVLDLMALEIDAPYYDQALPIGAKRDLIKGALPWRFNAGTKAAVESIARAAYGDAIVTEWFDFEDGQGEPGYFDIETDVPNQEAYDNVMRIIDRVKNASSHIRNIVAMEQAEVAGYPFAVQVAAETISSANAQNY